MSRLGQHWIFLVFVSLGALGVWGCSGADEGASFTREDDSFDPASPGEGTSGQPPGRPGGGTGGAGPQGGGTGGTDGDVDGGAGGDTGGGTGGGTSTGGGGPGDVAPPGCVTGAPPEDYEETMDIVWREMSGQLEGRDHARSAGLSILSFRNFIWDQILETDGSLNFCVRYESTHTVSAALRDQIEASIQRGVDQWIETVKGYDCWPYDRVATKVVGWAAMNRDTFDWADGDHPGVFYIGDDSFESAPQCAQSCGRFFNRQAGYTYPNCPGGRANHYDMSLWLTEGMGGGAGGDWGQRLGRSQFTSSAATGSVSHIFVHEVGHGFGLPDYYDPNWNAWAPLGVAKPPSVMVVGPPGTSTVSDWDTWMMRHIWSNIRPRFD